MTIGSAASLLHVALEDLHVGKAAQADRLPGIAAKCSDPALADLLAAESARCGAQGARIRDAGVKVASPKNCWMAGILDDAERDTRQTQPGRLLDIALVGAIRKAKAAEIVSSETAIALAGDLGEARLLAVVTANRAEEIDSDRRLRQRLAALAATCLP